MRNIKILILALAMLVPVSTISLAADFDWIKDLNIQAQSDPTGFRAKLASRFKIGDATVRAVLSNLPDPSDAYMALRLGEMSHQPPEKVIDVYKANKGKGWGVMAKELGIKPGSKEFKALKQGHDLGDGYGEKMKESSSKKKGKETEKKNKKGGGK